MAIRSAAAWCFAELGYARTTTNLIAERAGVSVGSLYQYFPSKDSLLATLLEQHHHEVHAVVDAALQRMADPATPIEVGLRQLLTDLVGVHAANPMLTKALSAAVLRESPDIARRDRNKEHAKQLCQVSAALARRPEVRKGDPMAMAAVLGQTTEQLTRWMVHEAPTFLAQSVLIDEVVHLLASYVAAPGSSFGKPRPR